METTKTKTISFHKKYNALFSLLVDKHKEVDTIIITGGRGSGKSYTVAVFAVLGE